MKAVFRSLVGSIVVLAVVGVPPARSAQSVSTLGLEPLPATFYVSPAGSHIPPFSDWSTAATNIQDAVNAAMDGDTVIIGDGHYLLDATIVVTSNIVIQSLNGPEVTIIDGQGHVRCFMLGNSMCVIDGLTISNGYLGTLFASGAGIYCSSLDPIITNCVITANVNTSLNGNGAGVYLGTLYNCVVSHNAAPQKVIGGGCAGSTAYNCVIFDNAAFQGGGIAKGNAYNCSIYENAALQGGGIAEGQAYNCTITRNAVGDSGGGMYKGVAVNSIIWGNNPPIPGIDISGALLQDVSDSCSPDLINGLNGNITNAPLFLDSENGNFHLLATSPCIDAGGNGFVLAAVDLDGNPRIKDGDFDGIPTVDMGAYEFQLAMLPAGSISLPPLNLKSRGRTPVTILSADDFDALSLDPSSVRLAGAAPVCQVPGPGKRHRNTALKLLFNTADLTISPEDTEITLLAQTWSGQLMMGMVPVKIVPEKGVGRGDADVAHHADRQVSVTDKKSAKRK